MIAESLFMLAAVAAGPNPGSDSVEATLDRYVADYRSDPLIIDAVFGIEVDGETWTVRSSAPRDGHPASAHLTRSEPAVPTFVWTMTRETFDRIASGKMRAITANAKAFASEAAPLEVRFVHGFKPDKEHGQKVYRPLISHFWTLGQPEVIKFGFDGARLVHGGHAIPAVYAPGVRTSWFGLRKGDHINKDPRSQKDPWSTAFFIIKGGTAEARIGDRLIKLEDNSMVHVPPETVHEFWNLGEVPAEMIMVTYGQDS